MADDTKIEWCDSTFNPWTGCTKVSPGCDHCYAESWAKRSGTVQWGVGQARRRTTQANWRKPVKWNDRGFFACRNCGSRNEGEFAKDREGAETWVCQDCKSERIKTTRRRVFSSSLADWLDLDVEIGDFVDFLDLVRVTPELDWLLLSKRIGNWRKRLQQAWDEVMRPAIVPPERKVLAAWIERWLAGEPPTNVWIGATVVNQEEADRDIPKLLQVPARVRFLSIEPMLGAVILRREWLDGAYQGEAFSDSLGRPHHHIKWGPRLHWIIPGGESGHGARPAHPDWFRSLRDQCNAAGVPFLFKQWGEWAQVSESPVHPEATRIPGNLCRVTFDGATADHYVAISFDGGRKRYELRRVGKQAAGRLLDGVTHTEFPEIS